MVEASRSGVRVKAVGGVRMTHSRRFIFILTFLCFAGVLPAVLYGGGVLPESSLMAVNVICVAVAATEVLMGLIDGLNQRKMLCFGFGGLLSALALGINAPADLPVSSVLRERLNGWSAAFVVLLLFSIVCLVVVGIRLLLWSQEQWEETRRFRQERLRALLESIRDRVETRRDFRARSTKSRRESRLKKQTSKQESRQSRQESRQNSEIVQQEFRQATQEEHLRRKLHWERSAEQESTLKGKNRKPFPWNVFSAVEILVAIALFFLIPVILSHFTTASGWFNVVIRLAERVQGADSNSISISLFKALLYYSLYCICGFSVLSVVIDLIIHLLVGSENTTPPNHLPRMLRHYRMPGALLIVAWAITNVIADGEPDVSKITILWNHLSVAILGILTVLVAVDIVDIIIRQCLEPDSLLRKLIRLIFVSVLDVLTSLLLGVLTALNFQLIISSLVAVLFPESESEVHQWIQRILRKLFREDLDETAANGKRPGGFSANGVDHRTRIWKRK